MLPSAGKKKSKKTMMKNSTRNNNYLIELKNDTLTGIPNLQDIDNRTNKNNTINKESDRFHTNGHNKIEGNFNL